MKMIVAIVMGFLSGWLIYMAAAMLFTEMFFTDGEPSSAIFFTIFFFGGWTLSTAILVRGAKTVSKIFSRGFLLGAADLGRAVDESSPDAPDCAEPGLG